MAAASGGAVNGHGHGLGNGFDRPPSYDMLQNGKSKSRRQQSQRCSLQTLLPASAQHQFKANKHKQLKHQSHQQQQQQTQTQPHQKQQLLAAELQLHLQQEALASGLATPPSLQRSPATSSYRLNLKRSLHLPLTPSYDARNSPLPLLHHHVHAQQTTAIGSVSAAAASGGGGSSSSATTAPTSASMATAPALAPRRPSTLKLQGSAAISASNSTVTTIHTAAPQPPAPSDFKYYSPQRVSNYPFPKAARSMRRQSTQSVDSQKVNIAGYHPLPMRPRYKHQEVMFELKSPTNRLTIRECDFGGGGEPCDDDQSIKDSQIFRVSKRNLYMNHRSPWKERDRYSNLYEYSFNIDLNSIIEDAAGSDSS